MPRRGKAVIIKKVHYTDTAPDSVGEAGASGLTVRWVITEQDGAENLSMRVFEIEPGGSAPFHSHPWDHEVFILEGEGLVVTGDGELAISQGDVLFIPPGHRHRLTNRANDGLTFVCLIPIPVKC